MKLVIVILIFVIAGCGPSINYASFDGKQRTPTHSVDVYTDITRVDREYKEIGMVTARGKDNEELLIRKLREEAATMGADAIIITNAEPTKIPYNQVGIFKWGGAGKAMRATAITYTSTTP